LNQDDTKANMLLLHTLVEVLVSKGIVHVHELEKRKQVLIESLNEINEQKPQLHLLDAPDKYTINGDEVVIDCKKNHPICKGMCCTLWFALSVQDLNERIIKWDYLHPYGIAQDQDGYCVHFNRTNYTCNVYRNRPLICRTYNCSEDKRVWIDFSKKIINPELSSRLSKEKTNQ
jgi:Fe-S-cluster containining protein